MSSGRKSWLSITPEPERELPVAIATLRAGGSPTAGAIARERARIERIVVGGRRRQWRRWLDEVRGLTERVRNGDPQVRGALSIARDVVANHDALALGLPGRVIGSVSRRSRGGRGR